MVKKIGTPDIDLYNFNSTQGFRIIGANENDYSDTSVSSAGDINDDEVDNIIIGAPQSQVGHGSSYVIFGQNTSSIDEI